MTLDALGLADWIWVAGLLGLAGAALLHVALDRAPAAAAPLEELAGRIRGGALRVLGRGALALVGATGSLAALLVLLFPAHRSAVLPSYVAGVLGSVLAAWLGTLGATRANVRSAAAAHRDGPRGALTLALRGGAVSGLAVGSVAVLGLGALYWTFGSTVIAPGDRERFASAAAAFALGATTAALLARTAGGIFAKSAGLAARRIGRDEAGEPVQLADRVGGDVSDVAGAGADLLESATAAVAATVAIAAVAGGDGAQFVPASALPVLVLATGLVASGVALATAPLLARAGAPAALRGTGALAVVLFLGLAALLTRGLGLQGAAVGEPIGAWAPWGAIAAGSVAALLAALATEYHTAARPLRRVAEAAADGTGSALVAGAAAGLGSVFAPVLGLAAAAWAASALMGFYGIGLAATGAAATAAVTQTVLAYGAVTDSAAALGGLAGLPRDARATADTLGAVGNTGAAVGKGVAIATAALAALALLGAFGGSGEAPWSDLGLGSSMLGGLLVGAALPFLAAALALAAVGRGARRLARAAAGDAAPPADAGGCLDLCSRHALRETLAIAALTLFTPPAAVLIGGAAGLRGVLLGALLVGGPLALSLANAGGLWDNAARFIAGGAHGGRGSLAHQGILPAEMLGDPLKDACAPAVAGLLKGMGVLALALGPWLARL